jgi:nucleoside-diphosphate-sugar epimerase
MRIAVTGASGNLGSATLRRIDQENAAEPAAGHETLGISRRAPHQPGPARWREIDLVAESAVGDLTEALHGYDALVHFAWKLQPAHDEQQLWDTNVHGTRTMLNAAAAARVKHVVVSSSVGAYSPAPKGVPVSESWPVQGIATSSYSRHKAEVERLLDEFESDHPDIALARIRPGLVFQSDAASEIVRLFLGPLIPTRLVGMIKPPVLPLPARLVFQAIHADDVAAAVWLLLTHRARGPYNVAAAPVLMPDDLARAIGARRSVPLPLAVLRALAAVSWWVRLQPTEPGWIDLAANCPVMSTERIEQLGWRPQHSSHQALTELVAGIRSGSGNDTYPPLISRRQASPMTRIRDLAADSAVNSVPAE